MNELKQPSWCKCGPAQEGQTYGCWSHDESLCHDCAFFRDIYKEHDDLAARLAAVEKRIEGLYDLHAVKLPPTGSIKFGPVRNDAKPSPDKQEMFSKQEAIEAYAERIVAWYAFPEPDELRQILSDLIDEALS